MGVVVVGWRWLRWLMRLIANGLSEPVRRFAQAQGFTGKAGKCLALPSASGAIEAVLFGLHEATSPKHDPFGPGQLPGRLPPGT